MEYKLTWCRLLYYSSTPTHNGYPKLSSITTMSHSNIHCLFRNCMIYQVKRLKRRNSYGETIDGQIVHMIEAAVLRKQDPKLRVSASGTVPWEPGDPGNIVIQTYCTTKSGGDIALVSPFVRTWKGWSDIRCVDVFGHLRNETTLVTVLWLSNIWRNFDCEIGIVLVFRVFYAERLDGMIWNISIKDLRVVMVWWFS